jgi:hypothetical protein
MQHRQQHPPQPQSHQRFYANSSTTSDSSRPQRRPKAITDRSANRAQQHLAWCSWHSIINVNITIILTIILTNQTPQSSIGTSANNIKHTPTRAQPPQIIIIFMIDKYVFVNL